jgi:DeoR/GlpR family transcriptional regulator of sugar metabolism
MLNERQKKILKLLDSDNQASVKKLAEELGVSTVTIRQDLTFLESEGLLVRVHGGAVMKDADNIESRLGVNYEKKLRIARKVASLIDDGDTILIESGSTNALLARELANKNVTIITTNVYIARQLRKDVQARVILPGGVYQQGSESLVGKITKECIDKVNFDKAFIGVDGYTCETGFTSRDLFRAEVSGHIISKCGDVFIVTDSSKFGQTGLTNICFSRDIHHIATDIDLASEYVAEFRKAGIDLILA